MKEIRLIVLKDMNIMKRTHGLKKANMVKNDIVDLVIQSIEETYDIKKNISSFNSCSIFQYCESNSTSSLGIFGRGSSFPWSQKMEGRSHPCHHY